MKRNCLLATPFAMLLLLFAPSVQAVVISFQAFLDGASESPPNASPGTGFSSVDIDTLANTLALHVEFSGLLATTTAAHIHCCVDPSATPSTVGVATTTPTFVGFPLGVTSGIYDIVLDLTQVTSYSAAFLTANGNDTGTAQATLIAGLLDGEAYLNIHTNQFPAGEIRGFFVTVDEPASAALLLASLVLAAGLRRRRA
jgi:MYXO-CTERM domain-containing protein